MVDTRSTLDIGEYRAAAAAGTLPSFVRCRPGSHAPQDLTADEWHDYLRLIVALSYSGDLTPWRRASDGHSVHGSTSADRVTSGHGEFPPERQ